jgi:hypothetical protein
VGRPEGKRGLARPRHKCEDDIKMNLQEVRWGKDLIIQAQSRERWRALVKAVMNLLIP